MKKNPGFTLIELMMVLIIIALLAAIALPSYSFYFINVRRSEGKQALLDLAGRMEEYYFVNHTYAGATSHMPITSAHDYYQLKIQIASDQNYNLQAIPQGPQIKDKECGVLSINNLGEKNDSGTGKVNDCW